MKKRLVSLFLSAIMVCSMMPTAFASTDEAKQAAQALYELGLFKGTGTNADGTPSFDLDRAPTRNEAVTMLVRLLGKESEATSGTWDIPFTDVADWAKPYVGCAYASGLTIGTSATTFGGDAAISASQYITFVLRALGYESGTDFQWDKAWELSDNLGVTKGNYNAGTSNFTRGDVAAISYNALSITKKNSTVTIAEELGQVLDEKTPNAAKYLNGHYWFGVNGNAEAHFYEVYYFNGNTFGCAYQCFDSNDKLLFEGYEAGTFTITEETLSMCTTEEYTLTEGSSQTKLNSEISYSDYDITVTSETQLSFNNWNYTCIDGTSELYETIKNNVCSNYQSLNSADYIDLAQSDFRRVRLNYPNAVAKYAYVYVFTNSNGERCVLTEVCYKIISNFSVFTLHNLTTGAVIKDPDSYYDKRAERFYGMSKIECEKYANEIRGYHVKMLQAIVTILESGRNPWDGVYVDASILNL